MTRDGAFKLLAYLAGMYLHRFQIPEGDMPVVVNGWRDALDDVPDDVALGAAKAWVRRGESWPPNAGELCHLLRPAPLTAEEAWLEVCGAAARSGAGDDRSHAPQMSSTQVTRAAETIGWRRICETVPDSDTDNWNRLKFMEAYKHLAESAAHEEWRTAIEGVVPPGLLPGLKSIDEPRSDHQPQQGEDHD